VVENHDNASQWVECPPYLYVVNGPRQFHIRINPKQLQEGRVYFTLVKAYDLDDPKKSCLFKIPITVVKAHE
jgi:hypothetical protein